MNLSIVSKEMFGQNEISIYQNENDDIFMTREQIGQALEYSEPEEKRLKKFINTTKED